MINVPDSPDSLSVPTLERYLALLCKEFDAEPVVFDAEREVHLGGTYEGEDVSLSITAEPTLSLVLLRAPLVALCEEEAVEAGCGLLLGLNLSPGDLMGTSFAMTPKERVVYLTFAFVGPQLCFASFRTAVLRLFALAAVWRVQLSASPAFHVA